MMDTVHEPDPRHVCAVGPAGIGNTATTPILIRMNAVRGKKDGGLPYPIEKVGWVVL